MKFSEEIAKISIETGAIQLNPETPFLWASGYRMPIYNDNRLLLGNPKHRQLIAEGFKDVITCKEIEVGPEEIGVGDFRALLLEPWHRSE